MKFKLIEENNFVADTEMPCGATQILFDILSQNRAYDFQFSFSDVVVLFNCRFGKIPPGEIYKYYVFVDEESGEQFELSCRHDMDSLMKKKKLYPLKLNI